MTSPITSVSTANSATVSADPTVKTSTQADQTQLSSTAFLKLLVAQLQYQDPSKPVDTSAFMSETATLTQVQTMEANSKATADMLQTQQAQTASSMVGKTVQYTDSAGKTASGVVSAATISATPPSLTIGTSNVSLSQVHKVLASGTTPS
ncbi:hypothetical protein M6D93_16875 [Jatrophihabitans telluris]|uniref:Flagellar hook capping protein n=1 Tax=Jatrophihabitans telluris TaxID=2038343 RepID=A0ABY4QWE3_9ACTN|nr:flagellar hook capping FlgD N-terminal domain-containing protein [Jatrophihabitans telluris]UQX87956.1 hypothetical protein M6D93_16875 [Jatrophihabitans telluris]